MNYTWIYMTPEEFFWKSEKRYYLIKLKTGEIIKANRVNGYWFGLWRWIPDSEVKGWTYLV